METELKKMEIEDNLKKKWKMTGGVPYIFVLPQILFFCDLKLDAQFRNPMITPCLSYINNKTA
jgi:hypothetical protein